MSVYDKYAELLKEYNDLKQTNIELMSAIHTLNKDANSLNSDVCYWRDAYHSIYVEYDYC